MAKLDKFGLPIIGAPVVPLAVSVLYAYNDDVISALRKDLYATPATEHVEVFAIYNNRERRLTFDELMALLFPPEPAEETPLDKQSDKA